MKRLFTVLLSIAVFMSLNVAPASAQFTLLPQAPEGADCEALLKQYEVDGKIPSPQKLAQDKANAAQKAYTDYLGSLDPIDLGACQTGDSPLGECGQDLKQAADAAQAEADNASADPAGHDALLGCAIKSGRVSLQMIPFFISYFTNFLLGLSGLIAMTFVLIGGFMYIYGGLTDQKEKGKKYIFNALLGMSVALLAWVIVSVLIAAITS